MTMLAVVKTETQFRQLRHLLAVLLGRYFRLLHHVLSIQTHSKKSHVFEKSRDLLNGVLALVP